MSDEITVKADALEPLFEAWEEPNRQASGQRNAACGRHQEKLWET